MSCRRTPETLPATPLKSFDGMRRVSGSRRLRLPAGDEVVALVELGEQPRDLGGIVLEVAVDRHDDVAWASPKPASRAAALPKLRRSRTTRTLSCASWSRVSAPNVPSRRAVVDEDRLPRAAVAVERRGELVVEQRDAALLVVDGDDDRDHAARVPAVSLV